MFLTEGLVCLKILLGLVMDAPLYHNIIYLHSTTSSLCTSSLIDDVGNLLNLNIAQPLTRPHLACLAQG